MSNELKPCECGGVGTICKTVLGYGVECSKNGHIHNTSIFETEKQAIEAWNRRADNG